MDTLGSLIDKLATVNQKMFINQELIYKIRRQTLREFCEEYGITDEKRGSILYDGLLRCCDLNVQRNHLIKEVDQRFAEIIKDATGKDLDDGVNIQRQHKTY